jgi:phosphatidate cytidylyltransferase
MSGDAKAPASRSDLPTRFVAGVVMVAVALLAIYIGGWLFRLLVAAAAAAMMVEWGDMHRIRRATSYVAAASLALMLLIASGILFAPRSRWRRSAARASSPPGRASRLRR